MNLLELVPALRMTLSERSLKSCRVIEAGDDISEKAYSANLSKLAGIISLEKQDMDGILEELKLKKLSSLKYLYIKDTALICIGDSSLEADFLRANAMNVLNDKKTTEFKAIETKKGRLESRIVLITGAAQGFGKGIAEELFDEGANIVIADLNEEAGTGLTNELNSNKSSNRAHFIKTDVSDALSVENLILETVKHFGGLDVMISNAGVLRAGGLDEMDAGTFKFMTDVNYTGYFNCAKYASAVMKIQNRYNKDYFFDIIQINSKSGLKGSKKNFAYAGGKFGGIGLTQSFALELISENIKVNSICPGNFFEGPLWSDPEKGLFVQYLNAGKVPGAKTIKDVQKFYESQVPSGRGCRIKDVSRAILYAIEQQYETGQAIPVTGGQNMLN